MITSSKCSPELSVREAQCHWKPCQISRLFEQNHLIDWVNKETIIAQARAAAAEAVIAGASKIAAISAATVRAEAALLRPPQPGEASALKRWAQWAF